MALRYSWPYNGIRYLGNRNEDEVHDLLNEKAQCNISLIRSHHIEMFSSLEEARRSGFDNCAHCLGDSRH